MSNTYPSSGPADESPLFTDTAISTHTVPTVESHGTPVPPVLPPTTPSTGSTPGADGKAGAAKEQASELGKGAAEAGKQVAGTAKDEAHKVASEAKTQARDLYHQTRGELTDQAATQQKRVATGLRSVSDELDGMARNSEGNGVASDLVGQAATRLSGIATWLDDRDPGSLIDEVKQFAARKPGVFIGIAAAAGLLAGRLTRGVAGAVSDEKENDAR